MPRRGPEFVDADDAPMAEDLVPGDPPPDAPMAPPTTAAKKPAVDPPVPAHGESASAEQLAEGERAVDLAGGGGLPASSPDAATVDSNRLTQDSMGEGEDEERVDEEEATARRLERAGQEVKRR